MKRFLLGSFVAIIFTSCLHIIHLTKNEDKGITDVLGFFGRYCEYSIGVSYATGEGTTKFFELKLSKSQALERFSAVPGIAASNAAYLFYNDLKSERKNYSEIRCTLLFKNGKEFKETFTSDQLNLIEDKMQTFNKVLNLVESKNFAAIKPLLSNDEYTTADKDNLVAGLKKTEDSFGKINQFILFGFSKDRINDYEALSVQGVMVRDKENNQFTVSIDMKPSENNVLYLDYKISSLIK